MNAQIRMSSFRTWSPWDAAAVRRALLFALAATLAFGLAALLHLRNPYWAAMPVWVIAQPQRGVLVERGVFRVLGTLVGAGVGLALMASHAPTLLLIAVLALWIAVNAGATHLLRGVHGYAALLAGMTAAIVVIPSLVAPAGAMTIAVARVACTLIGVIVASLVMAFQTPEAPLAEFYDEVRAVSSEAVAHAARILRGDAVDEAREERRILGHISQLDLSARLHSAGSVAGYRRQGDVDLLVLASLSTMAAAREARDGGSPVGEPLLARLEALAAHLKASWTQPFPGAEGLGLLPERHAGGPDRALQRLDAGLRELLAADRALAQRDSPRAFPSDPMPARLAPHREWSLAWREGALAAVASFLALAVAVAWPTPSVGLAAMGVCIFVMVLGSMPLPQLVAPKLIAGVALGVLAALFYRLVLQPAITTPAGLMLSFIPFVLVGAFFRTHPRHAAPGVDFCMCFLLASQAGMPATADVRRILLDASALVGSAGLMATLFMLLPQRGPGQAVDAATRIRRDLQRLLEAFAAEDPTLWRARSSRQILRLALHLGRAKDLARRWPQGLLAVLNVGQAMLELAQAGMPEQARTILAATLRQETAPRAAAAALTDLAEGDGLGASLRPLLHRLSVTLVQAEDLLRY